MFSGSNPMMARAVIDFPHPDSPTTPRLSLLPSVKLRLSKMLIGPDGCFVRTVKLLTVNKFKWSSQKVSFFAKCANFHKMETAFYRQKQLNKFAGWQAFWKA